MKSDYKSELNLLINQYRGAINKAQRAMRDYQRNPDRELLVDQCEYYKEAADLCGQIAMYYPRKQDRDEWLRYQEDAELEMQRIYDIATNRPTPASPDYFSGMYRPESAAAINPNTYGAAPKPTAQAPASAPKAAPKSAPKGAPAASGTKSPDGIPDEVVATWFRESPKHGFDQVSGMVELVRKLRNYVFNVAASRFKEHMGVGSSHSFFLYGPPGCGKTYIIEAFVHELMKHGYSFMKLSGADIHASLVGEAEKRVERAFLEARLHAPCILFIDEIDSVCRNRSTPNLPNHALNTTNSFLNAYNEMVSDNKPVIFIGATNYPNMVDVAMADRAEMIRVPLPDLKAKEHKFSMMLQGKVQLEPGFTYMDMAEAADNYSYRDFKRLLVNLTDAMMEELLPRYGEDAEAGDAMIQAVTSGEYQLTRLMFMKVMASCQPSKKDEIIRSLDAWDANIQKRTEG